MSWVKLDDQFFQHPRVVGLEKDAKLLYLASLTYCAAQLTDGVIPPGAVRLIAAMVDLDRSEATASVTALLTAGLWLHNPDSSYQIHDYLDYNPSGTQVKHERAQTAKRQQKWRDTHRTEVGTFSTNGISNVHSNAVTNGRVTPHPSPSPSPKDLDPISITLPPTSVPSPNEGANAPEIVDNFTPWAKACWDAYPARNGKKLHKAEFVRALKAAPVSHQDRILGAIANYAVSSQAVRGYAEDPHRFMRHWQDWEQPETTTQKGSLTHDHHTYSDPDAIAAEIARLTADQDVPGDGAQPVPFRRRA